MSAQRWRGWLVASSIFVLGIAVGATGTTWIGARAIRRALQAPIAASGPADRAAARIGADLKESLQLTPDQAARLQTILDASATRMKEIRIRAALQVGLELRRSTAQLAAELPPEKRPEFYRVIARRFERLGLRPPLPPEMPEP